MFTTAAWPTGAGAPALVTAGIRASAVHDVGDFSLDGIDFIVGSGKTTRLPDVRLRIRPLTPPDATSVNGLPTLTVERTIADLLGLGTDTSLACPPTQRRRFMVDTQGYGD